MLLFATQSTPIKATPFDANLRTTTKHYNILPSITTRLNYYLHHRRAIQPRYIISQQFSRHKTNPSYRSHCIGTYLFALNVGATRHNCKKYGRLRYSVGALTWGIAVLMGI